MAVHIHRIHSIGPLASEEDLRNVRMALKARDVQGVLVEAVADADPGAAPHEGLHHGEVTRLARVQERDVALVARAAAPDRMDLRSGRL